MLTTARAPIAQIDATVEQIISTKKGKNVRLVWSREAKTRKTCDEYVVKQVSCCVRIGCGYDNLSSVKTKRENGDLPASNNGLPWGEWETYPLVITHKGWSYLRCYRPTSGANKETQWFRNGKAVEFSDIENCLLASEKKPSGGDCFNVKIADIVSIDSQAS